jgi:hypothetical protein
MSLPSPPLPQPPALRLTAPPRAGKVRPPFGLTRWDGGADALAILLERTGSVSPRIEAVVSQIPHATTLASDALVVVLGEVAPKAALVSRWLTGRLRVPRHVRASALLVRGYTRVGGGIDPKTGSDLVWGFAP